MIAEHAQSAASAKFQVISQMGVGILELKAQIIALTGQLEVERARANKAEAQVHVLEQQLTHPKKEVKTLMQSISETRPDYIVKADREFADLRNQGWEVLDITVTVYVIGMDAFHDKIITLERTMPLPAEPIQPAAAASVVAAATKPAPAATPDPEAMSFPGGTSEDFDNWVKEKTQPAKPKTVTASAILEPGEIPVQEIAASDEPESPAETMPTNRGEEVKAAAQQAYEAALERNKMPAYKPIPSYKPSNQRSVAP